MDSAQALFLFAIAFGASALGGVLGMASGVFIVPLLTLVAHVEMRVAVGASLVSVIACSCGGAASYLEARLTNVRLALVLEVATTLGALAGVALAGAVPVRFLFVLFALILFVSAQQMLARRREGRGATPGDGEARADAATATPGGWSDALGLHGSYPDPPRGDVAYRVARLPLGMALMFAAGLVSALLGIGSGVLKIPAMDSALRLPIKVSSGTSNFMIGVTAAASAGCYFMRGDVIPAVAGPVAIGSVVGAVLGARLLMRSSSERLRVLLVVVLTLLGARMLYAAFASGGAP